ncbi:MAG TPA: cytidine deaminase [Saprospiraceae bacterium]|nr:cytidine deaminase [Saprospiraceae bacterium]
MEDREIRWTYSVYPDITGLPEDDQALIQRAIEACHKAYAPYSHFKVGAAIRTIRQDMVIGSNQENGAFPIGQCAERVALYALAHQHGRIPIDTIAIAVNSEHQLTPVSPCGSCRQLLAEYRSYQSVPIRLLLALASGGRVYEIRDVNDLLPLAFDGKFLGQ